MNQSKRKKLEAKGWRVGSVSEFLDLSEADMALIELHISLARHLRARRMELGITQTELAERIGSSQSRVAKMEAGLPSVSLNMIFRALFTMGVTPNQLSKLMAKIEIPSTTPGSKLH